MTISRDTLIAELHKILPSESVIHQDEGLSPFECDGLSAYREKPLVVVLPESIEHIKSVIALCKQHLIPIVTRGAGTGLAAGALPLSNGLLLVVSKLKKIISINPDARSATLQPGVRNLAISDAAKPYGLFYAPDPSSQIACSIGGNVAENSGGVHCLKYGLTVNNILQLKILTIEGELITLGSEALDTPGYDLLALLTGSEGLLGVIVEVTVKLIPIPPTVQVLLAAFDDVSKAGDAVSSIIASGFLPAGLEMMDQLSIRAAEDFIHAGYPEDAKAILLCEVDGSLEECEYLSEQIKHLLLNKGAITVEVATDPTHRATLWQGRKSAFPAVGRLSPDYYCMDGTIPKKALSFVLTQIQALSTHYGLSVANVFHAGDGNLHPLILYDANTPGELDKAEQFGNQILDLCVKVGGTITGEHGVGKEKLDAMCSQFNSDEIIQFKAIKHAFDAKELLNPGKAIPTLHRCAELGAMHVHNGELPFPDIPRF